MALSSKQLTGDASPEIEPEFIIGDDVLELISSAMYVDPLTMFREYVQNSADAIDDAKALGLLSADYPGSVNIKIDVAERSLLIRDNGAGIAASEFPTRLLSLGASKKRGQGSRGFRGVGRLAGLGFAKKLIFRSSTAGADKVQEVTWDCMLLRQLLRSGSERTSVSHLISNLTTFRELETDEYPDHFFEVELSGVIRLKSDKLLDKSAVSKFLGEVAPVPFSPDFKGGQLISDELAGKIVMTDLAITIDGSVSPILRPHNSVLNDNNRTIEIDEIEFFEFPDVNGEPAAIGWIAHHQYDGSIPAALAVKGLRFRCGNMQIGGDDLVEHLFPETRFNSWSIGEIHILDSKIVPNARRDNFEESPAFNNLLNHLAPLTRQLSKRCRVSSQLRNWVRVRETLELKIDSELETLEIGGMSQVMADARIDSIRSNISDAKQLDDKLNSDQDALDIYEHRLEKMTTNREPKQSNELISEQNRIASRFVDLIYKHAKDASEAKQLVKVILANLN